MLWLVPQKVEYKKDGDDANSVKAQKGCYLRRIASLSNYKRGWTYGENNLQEKTDLLLIDRGQFVDWCLSAF